MKIIKYSISMVICLVLFVSCNKDFIELTPPTSLPPTNYYKTEFEIKSAVAGVYGTLRTVFSYDYTYGELPSDNTQTYSESEAGIGIWDKMTWNPTSTSANWINHYNTIAQCNIILGKIDGVTFANVATKTQYIAEVKFIRALIYFNLVKYFGDVPLVLNEITNDTEASSYSRNPVADVYKQIEKDLFEAETGVPATYSVSSDKGRVTAGAVKSLLGKVYLYEQKYQLAETKLKEVVALSPSTYDLITNYADVFSTTNEYNKEIIFSVQYSRIAVGSGEGSYFASYFTPQPAGITIQVAGGASFNIGTLDLYRSFEKGDLRKNLVGVYTKGLSDSAQFYYYTRKFLDTPPASGEGENNWIVIRYSDVLLMLAEVLNEQPGKTSEALTVLQNVRTRAGLKTDMSLNQVNTRTLIKRERRVEFCHEGQRWSDLVRWNDYLSVMTNFKTKFNVPSMAIDANKKLFPIPQREITLNPKLTQNQGY